MPKFGVKNWSLNPKNHRFASNKNLTKLVTQILMLFFLLKIHSWAQPDFFKQEVSAHFRLLVTH